MPLTHKCISAQKSPTFQEWIFQEGSSHPFSSFFRGTRKRNGLKMPCCHVGNSGGRDGVLYCRCSHLEAVGVEWWPTLLCQFQCIPLTSPAAISVNSLESQLMPQICKANFIGQNGWL